MGASQGLDVWVLSRKLGSWSAPMGPAHLCQLPPVLFSHPNCCSTSPPRGAEAGKSSSCSSGGASRWARTLGLPLSRASVDPHPTTLFPPPASPPALSTQELAAQEVVSLLRALTPRSLLSLRCPLRVGFSPPLLPSSQPHWDWDRHGSSRTRIWGCQALRHRHIPPALVRHSERQSPPPSRCLVYSVDKMCLKCETWSGKAFLWS